MGTARTTEWLLADEHRDEQLALKRRLLAERHDEVFQVLPGTEDACDETLAALRTWGGKRGYSTAIHPEFGGLAAAALLVQEDLCVLADGILVAGCVCFPSHWSLAEQIGRPVTDIHKRVPGYAVELGSKVDAFLRRLPSGTVVGRRNFAIHELPDLFAPDTPPTLGVPAPEQWLRSERQTLSRLRRSRAVLFTIRTQQVQLRDLSAPARMRLGRRLRAEPEDLIAYRDLTDRRAALIDWLDP
ncbi:MAG: hypothetical protein QOC92_4339 [Acidimicrobiaceae bacterium]|jgi:hypothetical protein